MKMFTSEIEQFYLSTQSNNGENQNEKKELLQYVMDCGEYLELKCKEKCKEYLRHRASQHRKRYKIYRKYKDKQPEPEEPVFYKWNVFQYGSSTRNTSCKDSDIDIAISTYANLNVLQKKILLYHLAFIISKNDIDGSLMIKTLLNASYPIIRITQSKLNLQIDVSICDKYCEPTNDFLSQTIEYYESISIPIKPLIVFIKHWSKRRGINNAYKRYLNSYGYTLLVISFLQSNDCAGLSLSYLVYSFFEFYAVYFDASIHAISVHLSCLCRKGKKFSNKLTNDVMEIRDPINCKNNVASRVGVVQCERIKQEFVASYKLIKKYRDKFIGKGVTEQQSIFNLLLRKSSDFICDEDKENIHLDQNLYVYDYKAVENADCEFGRKYFQNNCSKIYKSPFKKSVSPRAYESRYGNPFRNRSIN